MTDVSENQDDQATQEALRNYCRGVAHKGIEGTAMDLLGKDQQIEALSRELERVLQHVQHLQNGEEVARLMNENEQLKQQNERLKKQLAGTTYPSYEIVTGYTVPEPEVSTDSSDCENAPPQEESAAGDEAI